MKPLTQTFTRTALCALLAFTAPQMVFGQGAVIGEQKKSEEGDRLFNAGLKAYRQGQTQQAKVLWEQAYQGYIRELGADHPNTLRSMFNLAIIYAYLGQYDKALELNEKTLELMRVKLGADHPNTLSSMNELALSYYYLGQYDKALVLQEKTLQLMRVKLGEDHPSTLGSMSNLAVTYSDLGQHDKALALNEKALQLRRVKLGEEHPNTLISINELALSYYALGQHDKALALHEKNLQLKRAKLGEDHPSTLSSMNNLAVTYRDLGQHDKALALNEKALQLRRAKLGEEHPNTLSSMHNLAATYSSLGQHDKALALNEKTLELKRAKLGEDHPDALSSMHNLAATYRSLGQHDKVLEIIPSIFSGVEKLRSQSGLSTEQRQSIFAKYSDLYQSYANWYAHAKRMNEGFNIGDLSKARTLTDSIKNQSALRSLPIAEQNRLQESETKGRLLQGRLEKLNDSAAIVVLQKEIAAHNTTHAQLLGDLQRRFPKFARLTTIPAATAADAARLLNADDVLVSYLVDTKGNGQVFVLNQEGKAQWVDLGKLPNMNQTVAATRELLSPSTKNSLQGRLVALKEGGYAWLQPGQDAPKEASPAADRVEQAQTLLNAYWNKQLIQPVLPLAGNYKRWIISPDKDLALLPFDTLPDNASNTTSILGQTRTITLVQSFAVYALLKQREAEYAQLPRAKELFAMGNAVYSDGWAENRGMQRASGERGFEDKERNTSVNEGQALNQVLKPTAEQFALDKLYWKNLPGTAREIKAVSAVFNESGKGSGKVDSYQGLDASEGKLQQLNQAHKLQDYRYMLFSAHGYLAQNPALSALVLSQKGNSEGIDGYVNAGEWPLYDLKSDLTVLSACDTGVGKTQAGESVMGLPYALFVAGNKNTILTLWPVDDDATAEFMRRFFTKIKTGIRQSDALNQTKKEFMQHPQWNHPKYWAAFVLYGV